MPKLLLADDSPTTQKVVQLTFADEGIDVIIADDGDTAMEMFDHHQPEIVLADINIPGLNGYEVCEAIRKRESHEKTPVVLLAGSFEPFDVEAAHRVGANDYLTKPFSSIRRLVATVTTLLDIAVKADDNAHDTVEPDNDQPTAEQIVTASNPTPAPAPAPAPAPGTKADIEEPDMFSTSDIENLYTQSVSDPVDTSSQAYESDSTDLQEDSSDEAALATRDDSAFDDELIETTYVAQETQEIQKAAGADGPVVEEPHVDEPHMEEPQAEEQPIENLSAPQIPVPIDELPPEEIPQSQIPTVRFTSRMDENQVDTEVRPSEEFRSRSFTGNTIETIRPISFERIDQTNDAAYFEPALEQSVPGEQTEQHVDGPTQPPSDGLNAEFHALETTEEQQPPYELHGADEQAGSEVSESRETTEETQPEPSENLDPELPPPSTPWDSYAHPQPQAFSLDESNLLEVPTDRNGDEALHSTRPDEPASSSAFELAPEIVDQIAKLTATHISEEMIREIAKRVVPKVIEEVMTGRVDHDSEADRSDAKS